MKIKIDMTLFALHWFYIKLGPTEDELQDMTDKVKRHLDS